MLPRLRSAHVTVVALVCAVALGHARGGEPGKMVRKVYAVADLVVPIGDYESNPLSAVLKPVGCQGSLAIQCDALGEQPVVLDNLEVMCQQPAEEPCCQGGSCGQAAAKKCCPNCPEVNGECSECPAKAKCGASSCCPNGACCPDGPCCGKGACCERPVSNWTTIAAPECYKPATPVRTTEGNAELLIKLIQHSVCPDCWTDDRCTVAYCPMGMGLVVNAPPDVQEQVADLLDQLRRLQNLQVAFECRLVRVADGAAKQAFDADAQAKLAAGQPLFLCCRQSRAIQKMVEGDSHTEVVCAPKMTVFNGQKAVVRVNDLQFFATKITPSVVNGQTIFLPNNEPFSLGFQMAVRPTVSADQRFVRCELSTECCELGSPAVPLFPVTTFVTPVFEGGAQGQPIPFTQFIQQPEILTRGVSKSLCIPDGCTAVLYAGKRTKEEPSEQPGPGAPLFDWIDDLVDLVYPPTPVPTYQEHLYVLVTPRVIATEQMEAAKPMPPGPAQPCPLSCVSVASVPVTPPVLSADIAMPIRQCAAAVPACPAAQPCTSVPCPAPCMAAAPCRPQVQLDICVMGMDPAAWEQPVAASWADLAPTACGDKKLLAPEEAGRFCQTMKGHGATMLSDPKLVGACGRPMTFCSGGQQTVTGDFALTLSGGRLVTQSVPEVIAFGTSVSFLADMMPGGFYLQCECTSSVCCPTKDYRVTIEGPDEGLRTETVRIVRDRNEAVLRTAAAVPAGRTLLMHCGRTAEGKDLIVMVTPRPVTAEPAVCMPPPVAYVPPPAPGQPAPPCVPAPMSPTVWAAPMPVREDIQVVSGQSKPAEETKLDHLMALYYQACQAGDAAEARKLARKCMAIDPTCFGR
jgi:hypothetical protein